MKVLFVVLSIVLCQCAYVLAQVPIDIDLGSIYLHADIGNVPEKYTPLENKDNTATRNAKILAETLRAVMGTGLGPLPPLDPYHRSQLEPIEIDPSNSLIQGKVLLSNLVMTGAKSFELNNIELRLRNYRTDLDLAIPELVVNVDCDVQINVGALPVYLKAHLKVNLKNLKVVGSVGATKETINKIQRFQLVAADIDGTVQDVMVEGTNIHFDTSRKFTGLSFDWIQTIKKDIANSITKSAFKQVNELLGKFSADDVITALTG